jgi:hypothetical protein
MAVASANRLAGPNTSTATAPKGAGLSPEAAPAKPAATAKVVTMPSLPP